MSEDRCVICDDVIPEGTQVCYKCTINPYNALNKLKTSNKQVRLNLLMKMIDYLKKNNKKESLWLNK